MKRMRHAVKAPLFFGILIFLNACGTLNGEPVMHREGHYRPCGSSNRCPDGKNSG